jgi:ABC-type glutathione transport system ATPase component
MRKTVEHDLNVVRLLCDRVILMRAGQIVKEGPTERVRLLTTHMSCWRRSLAIRCRVGSSGAQTRQRELSNDRS